MSFADNYIIRFKVLPQIIQLPIHSNIQARIVIPCYNEENIIYTLLSILKQKSSKYKIEVIIVVNYSENSSDEIKQFNNQTYSELQIFADTNSTKSIQFIPILISDISKKEAGVGYARKLGLDEAVRRFNTENNPKGILICLDADSTVADNYIEEIINFYTKNPKVCAANIDYQHPLEGDLQEIQYIAIAQYELHLRYYVQQLRNMQFPFAYHTVGSSCSVRADAYCRQGGMNKRQAGEDFYFLQKLMQAETFGEITNTCVYPSARISNRVPFGTGFAMTQLMENSNCQYFTYHPESFKILYSFFCKIPQLYTSHDIANIYNQLHVSIKKYFTLDFFENKINEIKNNTTTEELFTKRFYLWFNGFQVFKYLNFSHIHYFTKIPIVDACNWGQLDCKDIFTLLKEYRILQQNH